MKYDYSSVESLSKEDFLKSTVSLRSADLRATPDEDIRKMEEFLEVAPGVLQQEYRMGKHECNCGRELSFLDFVVTAVQDWKHPKSFILHTLVGNKYIVNEPRPIRCTNCSAIASNAEWGPDVGPIYMSNQYGCCRA